MNEIEKYFYNYNDRKVLPPLDAGKSKTIEGFYSDFIEKRLIKTEIAVKWHKMLLEYIKRDDAVFLLRKYESGNKKSGRWNTRRSAMTQLKDGTSYVFVSNFDAHEIYNMALKGIVPTAEEFANLLKSHKYWMHYDKGGSCEEIDISAYPTRQIGTIKYGRIGNVRCGVLNESGCYLAHIFAVNETYFIDSKNNIKKNEIEEILPRGNVSDWKDIDDYSIKIRKLDIYPNERQKDYIIAHFLRFIDPLNYFLTPTKNNYTIEGIETNKQIGEDEDLLKYVSLKFIEKYKNEVDIEEYYRLIMALPYKGKLDTVGKKKINISHGKNIKSTSKVSKNNANHKTTRKISESIIPITLTPEDVNTFKKKLIAHKKATFKLTFHDGHTEEKAWNAFSFSENSNVYNNIKSRSWWRNKGKSGLCKVEASIVI